MGEGVTNVKPGDRCAVEPYMNCGICHACRNGASNCCANLRIIGWVVNTQDHLRLVRALQLDGATTDYPDIKRTGRFTA